VGLQVLAVVVGALSFLVAAYLVNMTFINEVLAQKGPGVARAVPARQPRHVLPGPGRELRRDEARLLAIVVYEAWIIPRPPS